MLIAKLQLTITMTCDGLCHGMAGWFKIQLGDAWLSTAPHAPKVHWSPAFLPFDPPLNLCKGESFKFYLARFANRHWIWRVSTATTDQKHSTLISQGLSTHMFKRTNQSN